MTTGQPTKRTTGHDPTGRPYVRRRSITPHAIFRIRERLLTIEELSRSELEIANMLDAAVDQGINEGRAESLSDNGEPTILVNLEPTFAEVWALVRRNRWSGSRLSQAVVTILTTKMVLANRSSGRWAASTADDAKEARAIAKQEDVRITTPLAPKLASVIPAPAVPASSVDVKQPQSRQQTRSTTASSEWLRMRCAGCGATVVIPADEAPPLLALGDFVRWGYNCPKCDDGAMFEVINAHPGDDPNSPASGTAVTG